MNIIALTDIHGRTGIFRSLSVKIRSADLIILCGDITHFGTGANIELIIDELAAINPNILAIAGNCDNPDVEQYLVNRGISLFGQLKVRDGICFFGLGGSLPCPGRTPNEFTEEEYEELLSDVCFPKEQPVVLITHQPPFDTLNDAVSAGTHVGSRIIRNFICRTKPLICFTGHIHEGIGIDFIGMSAIVNPGPSFSGGYAVARIEGNVVAKLEILKS